MLGGLAPARRGYGLPRLCCHLFNQLRATGFGDRGPVSVADALRAQGLARRIRTKFGGREHVFLSMHAAAQRPDKRCSLAAGTTNTVGGHVALLGLASFA